MTPSPIAETIAGFDVVRLDIKFRSWIWMASHWIRAHHHKLISKGINSAVGQLLEADHVSL